MHPPFRTPRNLLLTAALAVCFLAAGPARSDGARPDCYVLAVGVDAYAHPNVHNLKGCVNDAHTAAHQFRQQVGKLFGKVQVRTLTDGTATTAAVAGELNRLTSSGKPGDFAVIFLSGHGGRQGQAGWYFLPHDYHPSYRGATSISDRQLLQAADALAAQGKKAVVIIDACYAGRLLLSGRPYLGRYQDPRGGGIVLMLSSLGDQTSTALGRYSAFAQAVAEGLAGRADANRDGKVTFGEVRYYSYHRVHEMLRQTGRNNRQDSECACSPSLSEALVMAVTTPSPGGPAPGPVAVAGAKSLAAPGLGGSTWTGSEDLAGFGQLSFALHPNGTALMTDARKQVRGHWSRDGQAVTIRFSNCVYRGRTDGRQVSGTAQLLSDNGKVWSWRLTLQNSPPSSPSSWPVVLNAAR